MASPELLDESAPPAVAVASAWLAPWKRGTRRLAKDPYPFRIISGPTGIERASGLSDQVVSIRTLTRGTPEEALAEAMKTHRRMMLLGWNPLVDITIASGQEVCVDYCKCILFPFEDEDYGDPNAISYLGRYEIGLAATLVP